MPAKRRPRRQPHATPPPEVEAVAEIETETQYEEVIETTMAYKSNRFKDFLDKVIDTLDFDRRSGIHLGIAVGLAVLLAWAMIGGLTVDKGDYTTEMERLEAGVTGLGSQLATFVAETNGTLNTVSDRVTTLQTDVDGTNGDINSLETRIGTAEGDINTLEDTLTGAPKAWLAGGAGSFTFHTLSGNDGSFTASIHLCYDEPVSLNATDYSEAVGMFYSSVTWTDEDTQAYVPDVAYNGTAWEVVSISFNIGTFALQAGVPDEMIVVYNGLPEAYKLSWAYADVWQVLKE